MRERSMTPVSSKVPGRPSQVTIIREGVPERRWRSPKRAGAPPSDHDGKSGYDTLFPGRGLYHNAISTAPRSSRISRPLVSP